MMNFKFSRDNSDPYNLSSFNVFDLDKSLAFYNEALDLTEVGRKVVPDGNLISVFLGDGQTPSQLELTWLRDRETTYDLGDNEIHLTIMSDDFKAAYERHKKMGCICYENKEMHVYVISDPDGYWIEVIPQK